MSLFKKKQQEPVPVRKIMTNYELHQFCIVAHRAECESYPRPYLKALRACLMALDYDPEWVEGSFRTYYEDMYCHLYFPNEEE